MPLTNYSDGKLIELLLGATAYASPATVYAALSTTTPTQAGATFTEPVGNAYARVAYSNVAANWPTYGAPATGVQVANNIAITFPQATGSWGTVTYIGLFDAASLGNLLAYGVLGTAQTINNGDTLTVPIDGLAILLN